MEETDLSPIAEDIPARNRSSVVSVTKHSLRKENYRVPTNTGKPGKMRQLFPVREKSGNFEKMSKSQGKVREF